MMDETRLLEKALSLYAGEHVLKHVLERREKGLVVEQHSSRVVALFVDVASFEAGVDGIDAALIPEWQERYLEGIFRSVAGQQGVVDIFMGDAVSAWWPGSIANCETKACEAALDMLRRTSALNEESKALRYPVVNLKIGIHAGIASVGPYGCKERLRFSVLGDNINIAAHLCRLSGSQNPPAIVISGAVRDRLPSKFGATQISSVPIKGGTMLPLYTLTG